jgi:hypothetical protein
MPGVSSTNSPVPWWVGTVLIPAVFLVINGYLVSTTTRLEKAVEVQTAMLVRLTALETKMYSLEKLADTHAALIAKTAAELQSSQSRLALLERGQETMLESLRGIASDVKGISERIGGNGYNKR